MRCLRVVVYGKLAAPAKLADAARRDTCCFAGTVQAGDSCRNSDIMLLICGGSVTAVLVDGRPGDGLVTACDFRRCPVTVSLHNENPAEKSKAYNNIDKTT